MAIMKQDIRKSQVYDRILTVACGLFYQQGYRGTGINQIIAESKVAKASFFNHFPSKEDLLLAYAHDQLQQDQRLRVSVESWKDPHDRFFAALRILQPWLISTRFRGCPFQILAHETPPRLNEVFHVIARHHDNLRTLFRDVTHFLTRHEERFVHHDPEEIAGMYFLVFEGAISAATAARSVQPVNQAVSVLKDYLQTKLA